MENEIIEGNKIKELLKPRYKVIADYPISDKYFNVGDVLTYDDANRFPVYKSSTGGKSASMHSDTVTRYPHLFKKLEWWEERTIDEMSEYVSYKFMEDSKPRIYKVEKHFCNSRGEYNKYGFMAEDDFYSYSKSIPAIQSEYEQYINSLTDKSK